MSPSKEPAMPQLQFGTGRTVITPPLGIELCGYGPYRERKGEKIVQDLYCTALALSDGTETFVWLSNDLIWVDRALVDATLRLVRKRHGLDPSKVVITNTHTHSGPATMRTVAWGEWDETYTQTLPALFADAIRQAVGNLAPGRIGFGRAPIPHLSVNRVDNGGTVDEEAVLIRIDDMEGRIRAAAINFSAHPVSLGASAHVCGDYVGDGVAKMEKQMNDTVKILFFQGSCGNLNCRGFGDGLETMKANGTLLKDSVLPCLEGIETSPDATLAGDKYMMSLPTQVPEREPIEQELTDCEQTIKDYGGNRDTIEYRNLLYERDWRKVRLEMLKRPHPQRLEFQVAYLRINDAVLVAHPLELFLEFGNAIKAASPYPHTILVGYANEAVGYLARPQDFSHEGFGWYAAVAAPRLCRHLEFEKDAGDVFCGHIQGLLHRIKERE